jgi:hypothetical protein
MRTLLNVIKFLPDVPYHFSPSTYMENEKCLTM